MLRYQSYFGMLMPGYKWVMQIAVALSTFGAVNGEMFGAAR